MSRPRRRAARPRRGRVVLAAIALVVALAAVTAAGWRVLGDTDPGATDPRPTASPSASTPPLSDFDTSGLTVERAAFCDRLSEGAVTAALGAPAARESAYGNGERAALTDDVTDVAHEYSCSFTGSLGEVARAWVFAPRVPPARARELVRAARAGKGCRPVRDAAAFGSPSAALVCARRQTVEVSWRGLFTDAWLSCSLAVPAAEATDRDALVERTGRWCVDVARAVSGATA